MTQYQEQIIKQLNSAGISISQEAAGKLFSYYKMLVEKNESVNLTAITEFDDVVIKHFCDSLLVLNENVSRETFLKNGVKIIDVGTGAGFPGIPLKIVLPGARVTLLDSLSKRVDFLNEAVNALREKDISAIHARAEDAAHNRQLRESFDICVSRAVADLSVLAEYCLPFVKKGGVFIAYKSRDCDEEISAAKKAIEEMGGRIEEIKTATLPHTDIERKFVIIRKRSGTPDKYPRRAGTPVKKPIR